MILKRLVAEFEAKNGDIFHFALYHGELCVNRNDAPFATVEGVTAETFMKECEETMKVWDKAYPHLPREGTHRFKVLDGS